MPKHQYHIPKTMYEAPVIPTPRFNQIPKPKTILLLNPFYPKDPHASFGKHVLTPSQALLSIAAATPPDWEVRYWDENLLQGSPSNQPLPFVVGITVHLTFAKRAFALADWYRQQGSRVILGGLHVQSNPEECAPHADALAVGEGAQIWHQILRDAEHGCLQKKYTGSYQHEFKDEPFPRRDVLPKWGFLTKASLIATRGCHNRCGFCYLSTKGLHIPYQMRRAQDIVDDFRNSGEPYGVFIDNNLGSKRDYLRQLCHALKPIEKIWSAAVTIDVTDEPDLIREMALAGCTGVFVGFESLRGENLDDARKKTPRPDEYARRVDLFHQYGIQVNGSFVLGFDHDTPDTFAHLADWIEANRLECATFHILTPYPQTPLFAQMEAENRILHYNWEEYDTSHVVFQPKNMTVEELEQGYEYCYRRLFSHRSIWQRRPQRNADVPGYLMMSYLYKRCNWLWPLLIQYRLTHAVWSPIVEAARRRHVRMRKQFETEEFLQQSMLSITLG